MSTFIYLFLGISMTFFMLTILTKHLNTQYSIVISTIFIGLLIGFGLQIFSIGELLANVIKVSVESESIYMIIILIPLVLLEMKYFQFILFKTNIPKKESNVIKYLERFNIWHNSIFQKIGCILIIGGTFISSLSIMVSPAIKTVSSIEKVQVMGIVHKPAYTDNRGTKYEDFYEFTLKYVNHNQSSTINNDNCDKDKLKEYYDVFKNNFEGIYNANVTIREFKDGVNIISLDDIIIE